MSGREEREERVEHAGREELAEKVELAHEARLSEEVRDVDIVPVASSVPYLQAVKIGNFGVVRDRQIGPFSPGFNLVFGPNEVGKTTIAAFIAGVLFGWDALRAHRDGYKPLSGERSGSLVFRSETEGRAARTFELKRQGAHGLVPPESPIVADIDKTTFRTLFSLTSDELRGLRSSADIVMRMLNVRVGTQTSPARALMNLRDRISILSDEHAPESLPTLIEERIRVRAQLQEAQSSRRESMQLLGESRALAEEQAELTAQVGELGDYEQRLSKALSALKAIESSTEEFEEELRRQRRQEISAREQADRLTDEIGETLAELSGRDERSMRARIAELEEATLRLEASEEMAARHLAESQAKLPEVEDVEEASDDASGGTRSQRFPRSLQLAVAGGIFTVLVAAGVPLFLYGRSVGSLSIWVLGLALVALAVIMAISTLLLAFLPERVAGPARDDSQERRERDIRWIVRQDEQRLAALREERRAHAAMVAKALEEMGLGEAGGSLRRARQALDEARAVRGDIAQERQREQASASRIAECERELHALGAKRVALLDGLRLAASTDSVALAEELERRRQQIEALKDSIGQLESRRAAMEESLEDARSDRSFDELKLRHQELKCRIADGSEELARLLLARRQMEAAISTWGNRNQPEIYRLAGAYLAMMTEGRWVEIGMRADGRLTVRDRDGALCDPQRLSYGSVQQLYLAVRLALLTEAHSVGRSIPVLADDILAHFDRGRQRAALKALAELAEQRQVIFFTCHEELKSLVEETLASTTPDLRILEL